MTTTNCILNHADPRFGGVSRCGKPATHLVQFKGDHAVVQACQDLAMEALDEGARVIHIDNVRFAYACDSNRDAARYPANFIDHPLVLAATAKVGVNV